MSADPDILDTGRAGRRSGLLIALGLALGAVLVVVLLRGGADSGGDGPPQAGGGPAAGTATSGPGTPSGSAQTPDPGSGAGAGSGATAIPAGVDPAYAVGGSLPPISQPHSGGTATQAARTVANSYCDRIDSWRIAVLTSTDDFAEATLQLTPSGTAYRTVRITVYLSWAADHYEWTGDRRDLEACP